MSGDEALFRSSRLVQDAVVRNLQTLAESSQRMRPRRANSQHAIDISPVPDLDHFDHHRSIIDGIDDTVASLPHAV